MQEAGACGGGGGGGLLKNPKAKLRDSLFFAYRHSSARPNRSLEVIRYGVIGVRPRSYST